MARFEASSDTRFMAQLLATAKPGDTISYAQLSTAIGRDVRKHARSALHSALRMQLTNGRVFEAIQNEGYRRLTDEEILRTQAVKCLTHIRKTTHKTARKGQTVDYGALSNSDKVTHNTQLSMLGAVSQMAKPSAMLTVQKAVKEKQSELAVGDVLRLMTA